MFVRLPAAGTPGAEPPSPASLARALTAHQREVLGDVARRGPLSVCWLNAETLSHAQLVEAGLISQRPIPVWGGRSRLIFHLTPEGEAVWQELQPAPTHATDART